MEHDEKRRKITRLTEMASRIPADILVSHAGLETLDLLSFMIAFNDDNRIIEIEAFAGCGKTTTLTALVQRLASVDGVLLLSFTRAAVRVAKVRLKRDNIPLKAQTFDSLFYHAVRQCIPVIHSGDYQTYRELSTTIGLEVLREFQCNARTRYSLGDIRYVLVDEAQDTPPEGVDFLRLLRGLGKTIVITGDRHQAIFQFMKTGSLFDMIGNEEKVTHKLIQTRRCCAEVVEYVNRRFGLDMRSTPKEPPTRIKTVAVQCWSNAALATLYIHFLFTVRAIFKVLVAEGESREIFETTCLQQVMQRYGCDLSQAMTILHSRKSVLEASHPGTTWVFSTVFCYKGEECDITILGEDVALGLTTGDTAEENVKYVAATRARWGIIDLYSLAYRGHSGAMDLVLDFLVKKKAQSGTNSVSQIASSHLCMSSMIACRSLHPFLSKVVEMTPERKTSFPPWTRGPRPLLCATVSGALLGWEMEYRARRHGVPEIRIRCMAMGARISVDRGFMQMVLNSEVDKKTERRLRRAIAFLKIKSLLGRYLVVHGVWSLLSGPALDAALGQAHLISLVRSRNIMVLYRTISRDAAQTKVLLRHAMTGGIGSTGIMSRPQEWRALIMGQCIPGGEIRAKGHLSIMIVDQSLRSHLIESRFVKQLTLSHVFQMTLSSSLVQANANVIVHYATVYNALLDEIYNVCLPSVLPLILNPEAVFALNETCTSRYTNEYFSTERKLDALLS